MKKFLFGSLWFLGMLMYCNIAGSQIYGLFMMAQAASSSISTEVSFNSGHQFAVKYSGMVFLFVLLFSIIGSVLGLFPGTSKGSSDKKFSGCAISSLAVSLLFFIVAMLIYPFGALVALISIILGTIALINIKKNPEKLKGKFLAILGILSGVLVLIFIIAISTGLNSPHRIGNVQTEEIIELTDLINSDPAKADHYFNRGKEYANLPPLAGVVDTYIHPVNPPTFYEMARDNNIVLANMYVVELAISDFSKAIEIKPDHIDALNYRAVLYFLKKDIEKSIGDAKILHSLGHPANPKFLGALLGEADKRGIKVQ